MEGSACSIRTHATMALVSLVLLPSCTHKSSLIKKNVYMPRYDDALPKEPTPINAAHPPLTVWIHGTNLIRQPHYYTVFGGTPDLRHVSTLPKNHSTAIKMREASEVAPELFCYDTLYCFGWSGKLRVKERKKAAEILYTKLLVCIQEYIQTYGVYPAINLVCHSHGGNIALRLAQVSARTQEKLKINNLILLACPVQLTTKDFVRDPLFKHVYAFYSTFDFVQVIAPEITHHVHNADGDVVARRRRWLPFSARMFAKDTGVRQARIKINRHAVFHTCFTKKAFLQALPNLLAALDTVYAERSQDIAQPKKEVLLTIHKTKPKNMPYVCA